MGEYYDNFLRLTTMILDYFQHTRILLYEISLFIYLLICLVRKPNFLPLLKPLKMNSSEFSNIFERAR